VLEKRAREFQYTPQIGRTHGVHAEPITFGLKVANWFAENRRNLERFRAAAGQMAVGKISGAVGNAAHLGVEVEEAICRRLGLADEIVAEEDVLSAAIERARHWSSRPQVAFHRVKASLRDRVLLKIRERHEEHQEEWVHLWFDPEAQRRIQQARERLAGERDRTVN